MLQQSLLWLGVSAHDAIMYWWMGVSSLFIFITSRRIAPTTSYVRLLGLFPKMPDIFFNWADFILTMFFGMALGHGIFDPQTTLQAIAAGVTWPAAIASMTKGEAAKATEDLDSITVTPNTQGDIGHPHKPARRPRRRGQ